MIMVPAAVSRGQTRTEQARAGQRKGAERLNPWLRPMGTEGATALPGLGGQALAGAETSNSKGFALGRWKPRREARRCRTCPRSQPRTRASRPPEPSLLAFPATATTDRGRVPSLDYPPERNPLELLG